MSIKLNIIGSDGWRSKRGLVILVILLLATALLVWVFIIDDDPKDNNAFDSEAYINSINTSDFANKNIEENKNLDEESLTALYLTRAAKYAEEGKFDLSLEDYKFADTRTEIKDYNMTLSIAVIAEKADEPGIALEYYKRAKQELTAQDPKNTQVMQSIDQKIAELGDG